MDAELENWLSSHLERDGQVIGHGYQAIVRRIGSDHGELVVKSPHPNALLALFGRNAIRREAGIYSRLRDISGIPQSQGLTSAGHLVLEHVPGPTLRQAEDSLADRERFFARLLTTLLGMHAAGVAHGDLKKKENLIVGPDETPYLIDFGVACLRPDGFGPVSRWRFETTRQVDLNAYIKLKYGRQPEQLSEDDQLLWRPLLIERIARRARKPWQTLTLRQARKRRRREREQRGPDQGPR